MSGPSFLVPPQGGSDDALLDGFLEWVSDSGIELYPAQEEAILELFADRHVVLTTPTGSGKSLVADRPALRCPRPRRAQLLHRTHQGPGVREVLRAAR